MPQYNPGHLPEFGDDSKSRAFARQVRQEFVVLSKLLKEVQAAVTTHTVTTVSSGGGTVVPPAVTTHTILSPSHSDTLVETIVRGDLLVVNSSLLWSRFALGTVGQFVRSDGSDVVWESIDTDDVPEGATNLYWTQARFDTAFAGKTTSDLAEGSNLYFTSERVDDRVAALLQNTATLTWTYNDGANTLEASVVAGGVDHGGLAGLGDDDHPQYLLLAGRAGGQTANGGTASGESLTLVSTAHATKGNVFFGSTGVDRYDETNNRIVLGGASNPALRLTEGNSATSYFEIYDNSSTQAVIKKVALSGQPLIDIDPTPSDGSSNATVRYFRNVTTSGAGQIQLYQADGTSTTVGAWVTTAGGHSRLGLGTASPDAAHTVYINNVAVGAWHSRIVGAGTRQHIVETANGTIGGETATLSSDTMWFLSVRGHTGSAYTGSKASISIVASENWSATANGTQIDFQVTPNTTTTLTTALRVQNSTGVGAVNWLRVGSLSVPANTTAGDFTAVRLNIGNAAMANNSSTYFLTTNTATSGTDIIHYRIGQFNPAADSSATIYGGWTEVRTQGAFNLTGTLIGLEGHVYRQHTGTTATIVGIRGEGYYGSTNTAFGTITRAIGGLFKSVDQFTNTLAGTSTITTAYAIRVQVPTTADTTNFLITNNIGIAVEDMTYGSTANNTNLLLGTLTAPSGNWSIYNSSTKNNYFAGNTSLGSATAPTHMLDVTGAILNTTYIRVGSLTSPSNTTAGDLTSIRLAVGDTSLGSNTALITQPVVTTGSPSIMTWTGGAHTTLTASTEAVDVNFNMARTVQFNTGSLTTQRAALFQAPTYGFVGASNLGTAATVAITGAPIKGTNATLQVSAALWIQAGNAGAATKAYGLYALRPSGATNNYTAYFDPYVGIGGDATEYLHVFGNTKITGSIYQDDVVKVVEVSSTGTGTNLSPRTITLGVRRFDSVASANTRFLVHIWAYTTDIETPALQAFCTIGNLSAGKRLDPTVTTNWSPETTLDTVLTDASGNITFQISTTGTSTFANQNFAVEVQGIIFTFSYAMYSAAS